MSDASRAGNRLLHETSPYLLQHARNPVDWYPWGPEALERARREDRPILLSIGYAACHWCHVMERESFENEEIAAAMNASFVCVKVDREERPDLDEIYMAATVAMTGHGGWPMTVFLTPDQQPFFAGTYFPPQDSRGRPGFGTVLAQLSAMWRSDRAQLMEQAAELTEHVRGRSERGSEAGIAAEALDRAAAQLARAFDPEHGGFGGAPKFPPTASLHLLLRLYLRKREPERLRMVTLTLDAMKNGGIYDQIGGGFARYSVDEEWLVPHFEKMLYDNAQLARIYLEAWQVTGDDEYRRVAAETLDYVMSEMQSPEGGYYSATDADSEGVEGRFFVWSPDQVEEVLGRPATEAFCAYFDVTPEGNWEGVSILRTPRPLPEVAADLGMSPDDLRATLVDSRRKLYAARLRRVPPLTDDKVLTAWNGLMISAMAEGARVLGEAKYRDSAERAARFLLTQVSRPDGGLYRTARAGKAHLFAYLEDYAFLSDALVDLYESGAAESCLHEALRLGERLVLDFGDERGGAFYQTARGHEALLARTREGHDGALPSANAVAARALSRLAAHTGREDLRERALSALRAYGKAMDRTPRAFVTSLAVVDFLLEGPVEVALLGTPGAPDTQALLAELRKHALPNRILAHLSPGDRSELPLLVGKTVVGDRATLYVCRRFTCQAPVTEPSRVAAALGDTQAALAEAREPGLSMRRVAGRATVFGTRRRLSDVAATLGEAAGTSFGSTGLTASRLGFGCYRVDSRAAPHREALTLALRSGVNVVDTSTNYGDGWSERLVGEVVRDLHEGGVVPREALILVSKVGYAQGSNLEFAAERKRRGEPFPEMVEYGDALWHCIHPEWIEDQLTRSLERLGVETLDVCLLHNPEYFLGDCAKAGAPVAPSREEFYRRVAQAFRHLENEVKRGRIAFYGVSSNTLADPDGAPETTRLSAFLGAAVEAGGEGHHFRVLQVPLNLLEPAAALLSGTGEGAGETLLTAARRHGMAVLSNRPLNAIVEGELVRLAEPPSLGDAPPFAAALTALRELEQEFGATFARSLSVSEESNLRPDQLLHWAEQLGDFAADVRSFEQWRDAETHAIAPRIMQVISALDRAFSKGGPSAEGWVRFRERYVVGMDGLLRAIRARAAGRSERRALSLSRAIDPALPEQMRDAALSQKALSTLVSLEGMTTVLVGMRETRYVNDALGALGVPAVPEAGRVLVAARAAELS